MSNIKVDKVKLLSERTSGVPLVIFVLLVQWLCPLEEKKEHCSAERGNTNLFEEEEKTKSDH